ncbi:DeoR/GlpR family DNA-binding transcription regulator [Paenibacillus alkaliterrae]|uniref:DeoR/GlpR family DNA-binding transcription regulator n=1 Tax=Paenibacillus alkaliterrae TaxID=320909 RepID=UPI001F2DFD43|nr:DeoR/GlpR family DNA-binding transcription regulator [Paenibacillus alkaliterrae]MCF2939181.1 DeoR/GlpR family DNA-binding transcription regulator [Paenibacillus alkaliterrae]
MSLTFEERKKTILERLAREERVQVVALSTDLNVSPETIRRDLDRLEKEGRLKKVYGGAVSAGMDSSEPPFLHRTQMNPAEKSSIGQLAASLVKDGETIMIDNGTTTVEVIRYLRDRSDITIVTHSVPALLLAMEVFKGRIIFAGGEVNSIQQSTTGTLAESMLQQFKVHKVFISVGGISLVEGITDYDLNEAGMSRKMMERAEEAIVLADHSKFGKTTFARISSLQDVSMIISDRGCPAEWVEHLKEREIELLIAE